MHITLCMYLYFNRSTSFTNNVQYVYEDALRLQHNFLPSFKHRHLEAKANRSPVKTKHLNCSPCGQHAVLIHF